MVKKFEFVHEGLHCLVCEDVIFSEYTHDFKDCTCGNCYVDGGKSYFRYGFYDRAYIEYAYLLKDGSIIFKPVLPN